MATKTKKKKKINMQKAVCLILAVIMLLGTVVGALAGMQF